MSQLAGIPVPSVEQIIIGSELVFILLPVKYLSRWLAHRLDDEFRKERNRIIAHHVKTGHKSRFKHCLQDDCANLQNSVPGLLEVQPELVDLELELQ